MPKPSLKTPKRFLEAIILDIKSIPGLFMSKKGNADWHLKHVCNNCSKWRKSFRDPNTGSKCMWYTEWSKGNHKIQKSFGIKAWIKYYFGLKSDKKLKEIQEKIDNTFLH